jgi:hypothetical protein
MESTPPAALIVGGTAIKSVAAEVFRQRIIADVLDVFLAVVAADPVQIGGDFALVLAGFT